MENFDKIFHGFLERTLDARDAVLYYYFYFILAISSYRNASFK